MAIAAQKFIQSRLIGLERKLSYIRAAFGTFPVSLKHLLLETAVSLLKIHLI